MGINELNYISSRNIRIIDSQNFIQIDWFPTTDQTKKPP